MPNLTKYNLIVWQDFKGLSDSLWSGAKGSFYKMVGVDIHSQPGSITVQQRLDNDTGAVTIDTLCKVAVALSDGSKIWFAFDSGKIWRESSGTYLLVYTTSPAAGTAGCSGAAEYNGFLYWATQSRLHRISLATAIATAANWTSNAVPNWNTFNQTDADFHPMVVQGGTLWIGDNNIMASVNSSATFTASGLLDLVDPQRIKTLAPFDIDIVIGTLVATTVNYCYIYRWDTILTVATFSEIVRENGVNAFGWLGTVLVAQCGTSGNWYQYDGKSLQAYKRIPGTWSPTQRAEVYPGSTAVLRGNMIFGLSNLAGNPAEQGIYTFGRYSKDYPFVLTGPDFIVSQDKVATIEIGAIIVDGQDVYVAWKDGATYGIDQLNYSAKYASARIETTRLIPDPQNQTVAVQFWANYQSLPASTDLTFGYQKNNDTSYTNITAINDTENIQLYAEETVVGRVIQMRIQFTVSSNSSPTLEQIGVALAN